jgi:hypothetical protein
VRAEASASTICRSLRARARVTRCSRYPSTGRGRPDPGIGRGLLLSAHDDRLLSTSPRCDPMSGGKQGGQRAPTSCEFPGSPPQGGITMRNGVPRSEYRAPVPIIGLGRRFLRPLLLGLAGGAAVMAAFGLSRAGGELLSAGFFVLALFMIPLTAGTVMAAVLAAWQESPRAPRRLPTTTGGRERCGLCRRKMAQIGRIWICPICDGVAIER